MAESKIIGIAELSVERDPQIITTLGLGSCIGVTMYDGARKVGGMVHIMLPTSTAGDGNRAKFADTGIIELYENMIRNGASKASLKAKLAGGAHMFSNSMANDVIKIGQRNAVTARGVLRSLGIPIVAEDIGGTYGRTIELHTDDGHLVVKTIGHGIKSI